MFRLSSVLLTDGPLQADIRFRTEEQRAEMAKEGMFTSISDAIVQAFQQGAVQLAQGQPSNDSAPTADQVLKQVDLATLIKEVQARTGEVVAPTEPEAEAEIDPSVMTAEESTVMQNTQQSSEDVELEDEDIEVEDGIGDGEEEVSVIDGAAPQGRYSDR